MDFLNNSFAQIKDLFEGMTPGSRILAGLLLAVVVVSTGYLVKSGVSAGDTFLFDNAVFTSSEIRPMLAAFASAGLNDVEVVAGRIRVPQSDSFRYVAALVDADALPQDVDEIIGNTIQKMSSMSSRTMEQAALKQATDKWVGKTIAKLQGIETAFVLSDPVTTKSGLFSKAKTTVTVTVTPTGSKTLTREDVQPIFHLVDKAYGLAELEDIAITDTNGNVTYVGSADDNPSSGGGHFAKQRDYKRALEDDIQKLFPGITGLLVTARVELDPRTSHSESSVTHLPDPVTTSLVESSLEQKTTSGSPGGNPGVRPQGGMSGGSITTVAAGGTEDSTTETDTEINSVTSGETSRSELAGQTPTGMKASITIPYSYIEKLWRQRNPVAEGEEPKPPKPADLLPIETETIAMIRDTVKPLLSVTADGAAVPVTDEDVQVAFVSNLIAEPLPESTMVQGATGWLAQSWQTLGMFALALFSLMMLRSMVKTERPVEVEAAPPEPEESEELNPEQEAKRIAARALKPFGTSGASLKDELSDLVAGDPDAAANILRNWIGTAAKVK